MYIKFNPIFKIVALNSCLLLGSQSLFAETDNAAEIDGMVNYLAAGMACASVTEQSSDQEVHEKLLNLVNNLVNKTYFYNEVERELIKDKAIILSAKIAKQPEFESKCVKLASNLK